MISLNLHQIRRMSTVKLREALTQDISDMARVRINLELAKRQAAMPINLRRM